MVMDLKGQNKNCWSPRIIKKDYGEVTNMWNKWKYYSEAFHISGFKVDFILNLNHLTVIQYKITLGLLQISSSINFYICQQNSNNSTVIQPNKLRNKVFLATDILKNWNFLILWFWKKSNTLMWYSKHKVIPFHYFWAVITAFCNLGKHQWLVEGNEQTAGGRGEDLTIKQDK